MKKLQTTYYNFSIIFQNYFDLLAKIMVNTIILALLSRKKKRVNPQNLYQPIYTW